MTQRRGLGCGGALVLVFFIIVIGGIVTEQHGGDSGRE